MANKRQKDYRIRDGKVYARIIYTDEKWKRRDSMRLAESRAIMKQAEWVFDMSCHFGD